MVKRIAAIFVIFGCSTVAWVILGSTIFYRTYNAGTSLSERVASGWGAPEQQSPPVIAYEQQHTDQVETLENGSKVVRSRVVTETKTAAIDSSRINADFHIDFRQKGLLWFSTYILNFSSEYSFRNPTTTDQQFVFRLPFPAERAV